jgi:hypothetical protein
MKKNWVMRRDLSPVRQDLRVRVRVSVPIPKVPYIDYHSGYVYGFMGNYKC